MTLRFFRGSGRRILSNRLIDAATLKCPLPNIPILMIFLPLPHFLTLCKQSNNSVLISNCRYLLRVGGGSSNSVEGGGVGGGDGGGGGGLGVYQVHRCSRVVGGGGGGGGRRGGRYRYASSSTAASGSRLSETDSPPEESSPVAAGGGRVATVAGVATKKALDTMIVTVTTDQVN